MPRQFRYWTLCFQRCVLTEKKKTNASQMRRQFWNVQRQQHPIRLRMHWRLPRLAMLAQGSRVTQPSHCLLEPHFSWQGKGCDLILIGNRPRRCFRRIYTAKHIVQLNCTKNSMKKFTVQYCSLRVTIFQYNKHCTTGEVWEGTIITYNALVGENNLQSMIALFTDFF